MSTENKVRVSNAFRAMKDLGISEAKVKPVLKNLLKLFDKNWVLIESENYRALADAIFEREEAEANEHSKKTVDNEDAARSKKTASGEELEAHAPEDSRRPVKRLRLRYQDGQSSTSASASVPSMPFIVPKEEPTDTCPPVEKASHDLVGSPQPSAANARNDPQSLRKNKGKQPISPQPLIADEIFDSCQPNSPRSPQATRGTVSVCPQTSSRENRPLPDGSPRPTRVKEWKVVRGTVPGPRKKRAPNYPLIIPKEEPVTDDTPEFPAPLAVVHPDRNGTVGQLPYNEPLATPSLNEKERSDGTDIPNDARTSGDIALTSGQCSSNLLIASSPSGEVKISLSCNLGLLRSDFDMPSLETVLHLVEEKCLGSLKTLDPDISLINIMKEICLSFLNVKSDQVPATNDLYGGLHLSSLTGANDQSNSALTLPKTPLVTPSNGTSDGCHREARGGRDDQAEETNYLSMVAVDQPQVDIHAEEAKGLSLVVDQSQGISDMISPLNDVFDIAKGQEKVVITLVNEVNNESPPSFNYIPQNVVFQKAYVNISLAHIGDKNCCPACSGNCLSSPSPCVCACVDRGDFAYTTDGLVNEKLLKECISMHCDPKKHRKIFCKECPVEKSKNEDILEPCKGHLVKTFIKECWLRCGCTKQCGNRVVQRGITRKLQDTKQWYDDVKMMRLKQLVVGFTDSRCYSLLHVTKLMDASPCLERLILKRFHGELGDDKKRLNIQKTNKHLSLKHVEFKGYHGCTHHLEMVEQLLQNADNLESLVIDTSGPSYSVSQRCKADLINPYHAIFEKDARALATKQLKNRVPPRIKLEIIGPIVDLKKKERVPTTKRLGRLEKDARVPATKRRR